MKFKVIASGSKGNCSYLETAETKILIDFGVSMKRVKKALDEEKVDISDIDAILFTHEHSDHVGPIKPFFKKFNKDVFITKGTLSGISSRDVFQNVSICFIEHFKAFQIGDLTVTPIPTSHDTFDSVGFVFECNEKKIVYLTDLGYFADRFLDLIKDANLYFLESNHDVNVLMTSSRPFDLKKRILCDQGHLSNDDSALLFSKAYGPSTTHVIWAHISEECNTPFLIEKTWEKVLKEENVDINKINFILSKQDTHMEAISI